MCVHTNGKNRPQLKICLDRLHFNCLQYRKYWKQELNEGF